MSEEGKSIEIDKLEDMREEFVNSYPKDIYGGLQASGNSRYFTLNQVLKIVDKYIGHKKVDTEEKKYELISNGSAIASQLSLEDALLFNKVYTEKYNIPLKIKEIEKKRKVE